MMGGSSQPNSQPRADGAIIAFSSIFLMISDKILLHLMCRWSLPNAWPSILLNGATGIKDALSVTFRATFSNMINIIAQVIASHHVTAMWNKYSLRFVLLMRCCSCVLLQYLNQEKMLWKLKWDKFLAHLINWLHWLPTRRSLMTDHPVIHAFSVSPRLLYCDVTTCGTTAGELGSRSAFVRITLSLSFGPLNRFLIRVACRENFKHVFLPFVFQSSIHIPAATAEPCNATWVRRWSRSRFVHRLWP